MVPEYLEQLQGKGIPLKDIAILVRKNDEGQKIAMHHHVKASNPSWSFTVSGETM